MIKKITRRVLNITTTSPRGGRSRQRSTLPVGFNLITLQIGLIVTFMNHKIQYIFLKIYIHIWCNGKWVIEYQLLEGWLLQVALQREVAETFPGWLVGLHLHRVPLNSVLMPDRTACHHRGARQALQVLREGRKAIMMKATQISALRYSMRFPCANATWTRENAQI